MAAMYERELSSATSRPVFFTLLAGLLSMYGCVHGSESTRPVASVDDTVSPGPMASTDTPALASSTSSVAPTPLPSSSGGLAAPMGSGWKVFGRELEGKPFELALHAWSAATQCQSYDYHPQGGIQNFWCHRPALLSMASVRSLAGMDIFDAGPHSTTALTLDAPQSFGHYNPAFVRWLVEHAGPDTRGGVAQRMTQDSYDKHMHPLAEVFWRTYRKATTESACFDRERRLYEKAVLHKSLPRSYVERWYYFMNPRFCQKVTTARMSSSAEQYLSGNGGDGGVSGNVAKTVVGFWVRRSIDGTMDTFAEGLKKLLAAYEPALLVEVP